MEVIPPKLNVTEANVLNHDKKQKKKKTDKNLRRNVPNFDCGVKGKLISHTDKMSPGAFLLCFSSYQMVLLTCGGKRFSQQFSSV